MIKQTTSMKKPMDEIYTNLSPNTPATGTTKFKNGKIEPKNKSNPNKNNLFFDFR